jgi:hypothetical protein
MPYRNNKYCTYCFSDKIHTKGIKRGVVKIIAFDIECPLTYFDSAA